MKRNSLFKNVDPLETAFKATLTLGGILWALSSNPAFGEKLGGNEDACQKVDSVTVPVNFRDTADVIEAENYNGTIHVQGVGPLDISDMWNDPADRNGDGDRFFVLYESEKIGEQALLAHYPNVKSTYEERTIVIREGEGDSIRILVIFADDENLTFCIVEPNPYTEIAYSQLEPVV